jgi:hypothetical protein
MMEEQHVTGAGQLTQNKDLAFELARFSFMVPLDTGLPDC